MKPITKEDLQRIRQKTSEERVYLFQPREEPIEKKVRRYELFKLYYFPKKYNLGFSESHRKSDEFKMRMQEREIKRYSETTYPGFGKSTDLKTLALYGALYGLEKYIVYQSSVQANVDTFCTDIMMLSLEQEILRDYNKGLLMVNTKTGVKNVEDLKDSFAKRRLDLVFWNGRKVRFEGGGIERSIRGATFTQANGETTKPTLGILDDISTTKIAFEDTRFLKILAYREEMFRSLEGARGIMFECGNITIGNAVSKEIIRERKIPFFVVPLTKPPYFFDGEKVEYLKQDDGEPNAKNFTKTEREAVEKNLELKESVYSSAEEKQKNHSTYEQEYECIINSREDMIFHGIEMPIKEDARTEIINGCKVFIREEYQEGDEYIAFTDASEGVGRDPNATVILNITKGRLVAYSQENLIPPEQFGEMCCELNRRYDAYWGIENNGIGYVIIAVAKKNYETSKLYIEIKRDKTGERQEKKFGLTMRDDVKMRMVSGFLHRMKQDGFELGLGEVVQQFKEMTYDDLKGGRRLRGHHFEAVLCVCGAWYIHDSKVFVGIV